MIGMAYMLASNHDVTEDSSYTHPIVCTVYTWYILFHYHQTLFWVNLYFIFIYDLDVLKYIPSVDG